MGTGRVLVVGTGLVGTSVGLALRGSGVPVALADPSPTAAALARDLGAGEPETPDDRPDLVVVAAPPDVVAAVVAERLRRHPDAVVTDVASVKSAVLADLRTLTDDLTRYVGSHPMAGRERSGAVAGRADLFEGRPWVVVPHASSTPAATERVTALATAVGAAPVTMDAAAHDEAVAAVSHVPQVAATLVAARLRDLPGESVALAGQGVRDVTRIAESDPALWTQILAANAAAVSAVLQDLHEDLGDVITALTTLVDDPRGDAPGARMALAGALAHGNAGRARIPGKHGARPARYETVTVLVPDRPGTLGRLFADIGDVGVNVEDIRMEHAVGRLVGVVDVMVAPAAVEPLRTGLEERGWTLSV